MNIVIYPGSFDPIHTGHACMASWVSQFMPEVDALWLLITPTNPLKPQGYVATDAERVAMARMVADSLSRVEASEFEYTLPRPSYTYATLSALRGKYPQHHFRLLIGSDNWHIFHRWRDSDKIVSEFGVLIFTRPGYEVDPSSLPAGAQLLSDAPCLEISSTFIRQGIAAGRDMNYFLPSAVYDYINEKGIYK